MAGGAVLVGNAEPVPVRDPAVDKKGFFTDVVVRWFEQSLLLRAQLAPARVQDPTQLTSVDGSTTGTLGGDIAAGLYRVTVYREVVQADPVSQSLDVVIAWTHNGKALTRLLPAFSGAPMTINDSAGDVTAVEIDPGTPISYTLTYLSNTPGLGKFAATLSAELIASLA